MAGRKALAVAFVMLLNACGHDQENSVGESCQLQAGDIIISEIFPATKTESENDPTFEWIELYNRSSKNITLNRAILQINNKQHILQGDLSMMPDDYLVIGNSQQHFIDHVIHTLVIADDNTSINLTCQNSTVDAIAFGVTIPAPSIGSSLVLDVSALRQNIDTNDADLWCQSKVSIDGINFGSPGQMNRSCGVSFCEQGGEARPVNAPKTGELLINEIFANAIGADLGQEWLELYITGEQAFDLNGVKIVQTNAAGNTRQWQMSHTQCLVVQPKQYVLIGINAIGPLSPSIAFTATVAGKEIYNSVSSMELLVNDIPIDRATLDAAKEGVSQARSPDNQIDPLSGQVVFCPEHQITAGITASPGKSNTLCGMVCLDNGDWRRPIPVHVGDLFISEIFSNPSGADADKEWIEFFVSADQSIDLFDLKITNTRAATLNQRFWYLSDEQCLPAPAGAFIIVGSDPALLTLPNSVPLNSSPTLYNDKANLKIENAKEMIDSAELPDSTEGVSISLDRNYFNPIDNDNVIHFCDSQSQGIFTEIGTPGQINDLCGI